MHEKNNKFNPKGIIIEISQLKFQNLLFPELRIQTVGVSQI